jgi:peptide/nickel transport system substrate-binding protein
MRPSAPGSARSVVVENPEPIADILDIFSEFYICRADAGGRPVLGTGPYRVEAFERGVSARLVSGDGRVVEVRCEADAEARYRLLKAGGGGCGAQP